MNVKYSGINTIKAIIENIASKYATKDTFSVSKSGLVPAPSSSDTQKILVGNCTWQNETVSLSDDDAFVPLEGGNG